jgi:hypothetical protein
MPRWGSHNREWVFPHAGAEATEAAAPEAAEAASAAPRRIAGTPHARLRADAPHHGGIREKLATGVGQGKADDRTQRTGSSDFVLCRDGH